MLRVRHAWRGSPIRGRSGWFLELALDDNWEADIALLKNRIPAGDRTWDPERERWWVSVEHETTLAAMLAGFEAYLHQLAFEL